MMAAQNRALACVRAVVSAVASYGVLGFAFVATNFSAPLARLMAAHVRGSRVLPFIAVVTQPVWLCSSC
jgi:hypothetical protein